ncbi:MAG TPA: TIGR02270 family protein [Rubrivivax sp.]|nr:TIGR02270 family protein [Rubrivivax sp.]
MAARGQPSAAPAAAAPGRAVWPVVRQHVEDAAHLRQVRRVLVRAPHVALHRLARHDERIAAHVDGMVVNAAAARRLVLEALASPSPGGAFAAATLALLTDDDALLADLRALAATLPQVFDGLASALGWVGPARLRGTVRDLLASGMPALQRLGITACALHRVDPGPALLAAAHSDDAPLRAAALRCAGVLGRSDLLPMATASLHCASGVDAPEARDVTLGAALAACRFGQGALALTALERLSHVEGWPGLQALSLALSSAPAAAAAELARAWGAAARGEPSALAARRAIQSVALLGQVEHLPWLIGQMADPALARLAGEAFSWITGIDLAASDLETPTQPPQTGSAEPADCDGTTAVDLALAEDDSLPWPDAARIARWWGGNRERFAAGAAARFMGHAPHDAHALRRTLHSGGQRQRHHAAWLLGLQQPGTPLFAVCAPAPRQRALLARLSG